MTNNALQTTMFGTTEPCHCDGCKQREIDEAEEALPKLEDDLEELHDEIREVEEALTDLEEQAYDVKEEIDRLKKITGCEEVSR